ncbi:MAG: hypothetical protein NT126_07140 [Bacteroidetes bacterium]|nr:hypothetical protein [Bacteroidota bacterium]
MISGVRHDLIFVITFFLIHLYPVPVPAQSFKYRHYNFKWNERRPPPIAVDERFKNEDAVILEEENVIGLSGYSCKKHIRIKFLTPKGIERYARFVVPDSYDPVGDLYGVDIRRRDTIFRPKGEFECVRYFAARIIKPNGDVVDAELDETTQKEEFTWNNIDQEFFTWIFKIKNIQVGDEVEAEYAFEKVFNSQPSNKFFFNGVLAKQNFRLSIKHSSRDIFIFSYHNGAEPTDSVAVSETTPHFSEMIFKRTNLAGGINEAGYRPCEELPYVTFYQHNNDYGELDRKTEFVKTAHPYPWTLVYESSVKYMMDNLDLYLSKKDKSTLALNHFFSEQKEMVKDTNPAAVFSHMHHVICNEFGYQDDVSYFEKGDQGLEKLGKFIEEKKLRFISRYHLYDQLLLRLNRDCFLAPLFDKRIEVMNIDRYEPMVSERFFYGIPVNGNIIYYYPKTDRFGYESNEFPFYYEDVNTILIPQHAPASEETSYGQAWRAPHVNYFFAKTPFSTLKDNARSTNVLVTVQLDSMRLSFEGKVKLSGQFSTLTRGYYLYGCIDTTINPSYFRKACDIGQDVIVESVQVNSVSQQFPFVADVKLKYHSDSKLKKLDERNYSIGLSRLFNNVTDDAFSASGRRHTYYPDFQSQDVHKYFFKFDREVEAENAADLMKEIENHFANYSVRVYQPDTRSIILETVYVVKATSVPATNAADVETVFSEIKKLNSSFLKVRLK